MEKRPLGLKIIIIVFFVLAILSFSTVIINPVEIKQSIYWGRIWGLLWTILDSIIFYSLLTKAPWSRNLLIVAYILNIIPSVFSGSFWIVAFGVTCWSIIYLPSIRYLNKPNVKEQFIRKRIDSSSTE